MNPVSRVSNLRIHELVEVLFLQYIKRRDKGGALICKYPN